MRTIGLTQRVDEVPPYQERRDCLDQSWSRLLCHLGFVPLPLSNRVEDVPSYLNSLNLTRVILTGGNDLAAVVGATNTAPERDRFESQLLDFCIVRKLPVLGICRGMQMLNIYFGGGVRRVSHHSSNRHEIYSLDHSITLWENRFEVNSYHNYGLFETELGKELLPLAKSPDGTVEALRHVRFPFWGIMWHPERERPFEKRDLLLIQEILGEKK